MAFGWQDIVALLLISLAASYLVLKAWRLMARKSKAGCGGCPTCPSEPAASKPSVPLDDLLRSARDRRSP